ncbi:MAG TPA: DUF302 domain-containing protein [Cyclobacteriaceae bacterium]|nr:DUF302 domain-containing protein [Cyclobacteriaceae bacterium]
MSYYFNTTINLDFAQAVDKVKDELKKEGFGVLTEIDVKDTFRKKLDIDFRNYRILGACNPSFAHRALLTEEKAGVMLPCNVVVEELEDRKVEVTAVDPVASMSSIPNQELESIAGDVREKLKRVISNLG